LERELTIASELKELNSLRIFLNQIFSDADLNREYFNRILLGLSEAVSNSIIHGNKNDCSKKVFISFFYQEKKLVITVRDEGTGFSIDDVKDPTLPENRKMENGRGLFLIQQIADEVYFFDGGKRIQILYSLG
jgi:serine/threonine-protein kinase RsbW